MHQMLAHKFRMDSLKEVKGYPRKSSIYELEDDGRSTPIHGKSHVMTSPKSSSKVLFGSADRDLFGMPKA